MTHMLYVLCRREGMSEFGGIHAICEGKERNIAIDFLLDKAKWLTQIYDEVICEIIEKDTDKREIVDARTLYKATI